MNRKTEFFKMDGLPFYAAGNPVEQAISIREALLVVQGYCQGQERGDAADRALVYLADQVPKIGPFCRTIRETYHMDDATESAQKAAICGPALRGIRNRILNRPV